MSVKIFNFPLDTLQSCGITSIVKRKKEERKVKLKVGMTLEPQAIIYLEEIRMSHVREGRKPPKKGDVVKEALHKLWQEVVKK